MISPANRSRDNSLSYKTQFSSSKPTLTFSKLGDWSTMTAARWHDAMYVKNGYFAELWSETIKYTLNKAQMYCNGAHMCTNVEVGSGTGDVILGMADKFRLSIGLDINTEFLQFSEKRVTDDIKDRVKFIHGSATELIDIMKEEVPELRSGPVIVTCVNNTIGIFPDEIKAATYRQMQELAGENGIVIIGFWNGNKFGDALQHFYARNPKLCGSMEGAIIDWENHTLTTSGGYRTHWSTPEEARSVLLRYGFDVIDVTEIGRGVLCTCRGKSVDTSAPSTIDLSIGKSFSPNQKEVEDAVTSFYQNAFQQEFYKEVWGGQDQHIGLYTDPSLKCLRTSKRISKAGCLATEKLLSKVCPFDGARIADFGSGYGSTARHLASNYNCSVTCIELSQYSNEINRKLCMQAGLESKIEIGSEKSFFKTDLNESFFDFVISQDAFCHAEDVAFRAFEEAARVLKPNGILAFTNTVVDPQVRHEEMEGVLERLKLCVMDSPDSLVAAADLAGFELVEFEDSTDSLVQHFCSLIEVLREKSDILAGKTSKEYVMSILKGLENWRDAGINGSLRWGFFVFSKSMETKSA